MVNSLSLTCIQINVYFSKGQTRFGQWPSPWKNRILLLYSRWRLQWKYIFLKHYHTQNANTVFHYHTVKAKSFRTHAVTNIFCYWVQQLINHIIINIALFAELDRWSFFGFYHLKSKTHTSRRPGSIRQCATWTREHELSHWNTIIQFSKTILRPIISCNVHNQC